MARRSLPMARLRGLAWTRGLDAAAVAARRQQYGPNDILEVAGRPWWDLARDSAKDPMLWFLAGASLLYAVVGESAEAATLLVAIVPLLGMDAFLHRRTQVSTEGLRGRLAERATVLREGGGLEIAAAAIVPGDLVLVGAGEAFPADGVVVDGRDLQADESTLTGEAFAVSKRPLTAPPAGEEPSVAGEHWGFAGTRLLTGRASLRVVFTGGETVYGEIVRSATGGAHARTPLQRAIQRLVGILVAAAAGICVVLAGVRLAQGHGWVDALLSAVTLAAAALPEEFPVVFTFFLGVGVYRLARRQALVRRAVSVENIGRISTICSDKTGTMTEGRLRLTHLLPATPGPSLLRWAALASRADSGDPVDGAIEREIGADAAARDWTVLTTFPFTEGTRREAVIVRGPDGALGAVVKGAVETVLALATADEAREAWQRRADELAAAGHKVIACGWRPLPAVPDGEPGEGYRVAGLLAFEDPVREGVTEAIGVCREAGIHTIMVTGDHPLTARAVAQEIGLGAGTPTVISGDELAARVAAGQGSSLQHVDVIARATPAQKLGLVKALQAAGEIVAVTGDGVNDVPALRAADVGVAMGERGTRSAREAAAIVLLDDNFRTIVRAIGEGRQLFRNLQMSFQYLLMVHIPLVLTALLIPLAGYPLLYLPVHIVWLEMVIHPTALLVFQEMPVEPRRIGNPAGGGGRFFAGRAWAMIAAVGGLITVLVAAGYLRSAAEGEGVEHGRAMALAALTFASAAVTAGLSGLRTRGARLVAGATVACSAVLIQAPTLARLLHLVPLHLDEWLAVLAGTGLVGILSRRART